MQETQENQVQYLGQGHPLEEWRPAPVFLLEESHTEDPDGLQSIRSQESDMTGKLPEHIEVGSILQFTICE